MATDPTKLVFDGLPVPSPGTVRLTFGDDSPEPPAPPAHGVRLAFGQPAATSPGVVRLVFGGTDDGPAPSVPDATLHGTGRITGLRLHITARTGLQLVGSGRITGMRLHVAAAYKINAARPMVARTNAVWQVANPRQSGLQDRAQDTIAAPSGTAQHWQPATRTPSGAAVIVQNTLRAPLDNRSAYNSATRAMQDARTLYSNARRDVRRLLREAFANAQRGQTQPLTLRHQDNLRDRRPWSNTGWQGAQRQGLPHTSGQGPALWLHKPFDGDYQNAMRPPPGIYVPTPVVPQPDPCYLPTLPVRLVFGGLADSSLPARLVFVCERHAPEPGETVVVPIKRVYMVINNATLRRVSDNALIPTISMSMSLEVDSWTWSFSASLPWQALPLVDLSSVDPVEVQATINGVAYRFLVEKIGTERTFGSNTVRVSGRGKSAFLDSPYAPSMFFGNTTPRTAQQLMGDVLTLNGVPLDWTINWGITDWVVPGNVWTHQGSYISALTNIAAAPGAYIQPHPTLQELFVLPRYPAMPHQWGDLTPDFDIPSAVMTREGIERNDLPIYDRVFVSGTTAGVLGQVTRAGTSGELIKPMVTDALITHVDAARQRGIAELSPAGRQFDVTLRMPVLEETGIIPPGKLVLYRDGGVERLGFTRSVQVDVGLPDIWQSIGVETYA